MLMYITCLLVVFVSQLNFWVYLLSWTTYWRKCTFHVFVRLSTFSSITNEIPLLTFPTKILRPLQDILSDPICKDVKKDLCNIVWSHFSFMTYPLPSLTSTSTEVGGFSQVI